MCSETKKALQEVPSVSGLLVPQYPSTACKSVHRNNCMKRTKACCALHFGEDDCKPGILNILPLGKKRSKIIYHHLFHGIIPFFHSASVVYYSSGLTVLQFLGFYCRTEFLVV